MTDPEQSEEMVEASGLGAPPHQLPYDLLQPPVFDERPQAAPDFRARPIWPCLGPALWMGGVLLWSYVSFGRLVLRQGFPEVAGFLSLAACFALSAYVSLERSLSVEPPLSTAAGRTRILQALVLAVGLFLGAVSLAIMIGLTSSEDLDAALSLFLSITAIVAIFVGRRGIQAPWLAAEPAQRALGILLWLAAIGLTLLAWGS